MITNRCSFARCGVLACIAAALPVLIDSHQAHGAGFVAQRIAYEGQVVTYGKASITLGTVNAPFINSLGQPGFTGGASPGGNFVWFNDGITWLNSDDTTNTLSGTEGTMGISDAAGFIYSPSFNGFDACYTHDGKLLADEDPHPALPGFFSVFNSRPTMLPNGTAYWVGGYSATAGGATAGRVFVKCTDTSDPNTITKVLQTGDLIGGLAISSTGLGFAYDVSDNGSNYMISALVGASTATDDRVLVNGIAVAAAGTPTGAGDNWSAASSFADMSINNNGDYIFTGDTDGLTSADEVMVYNGAVVLREGMVVDGLTLGGACLAASINNLGKIVFAWSTTSPTGEALFYGDAAAPASAVAIARIGDQVDYNDDTLAEATLTDLNAAGIVGPGLSLSDHNHVFFEVSLEDLAGGAEYDAILKIDLPVDCPEDTNNDGTVNVTDLLAVISAWGPCATPPCAADINGDGQINVTDLLAVISAWGRCP